MFVMARNRVVAVALAVAVVTVGAIVLYGGLQAADDETPPPCCSPGVEAPPPYYFDDAEDIAAAEQLPEPERSRILKILEDSAKEKFTGVIGPFSVIGETANIEFSCPGEEIVRGTMYSREMENLLPLSRATFGPCSTVGTPEVPGWNMIQAFLYTGPDPVEVPLSAPRDRLFDTVVAGKPVLVERAVVPELPNRLVVIARQPSASQAGILMLVDANGGIEAITKTLEPMLLSY
jgi:hypothetical protein